jgi:hypothetical protein
MNLTTLSGVYENGRRLVRLLQTPNGTDDQIKQKLEVLARDDDAGYAARRELDTVLNALESHLRVMGLGEVERSSS